jgi:hypothetical protein
MKSFGRSVATVVFETSLLVAAPLHAAFDNWKFDEVFSSADGSVQFIEMIDEADGENQVAGQELTASDGALSLPNDEHRRDARNPLRRHQLSIL